MFGLIAIDSMAKRLIGHCKSDEMASTGYEEHQAVGFRYDVSKTVKVAITY